MGEAMTREAVERELREKLTAHAGDDESYGSPLIFASVEQVLSALLPWIMEMREDAAVQARIDDGQLP